MHSYDYLIVGGGMVADAAARGIREVDTSGSIGILSADIDEPYTRPALSKKLWTDPDFTWDRVPLGTAEATGAEIRLRTLVTGIDRGARSVTTASGEAVGYGRLLLATGSTPHGLDEPASDRILFFRSADDYRTLRTLATEGSRIVVVGGGYIGTEIAAALASNGVQVDLVFPDDVLGASTFPPRLAARFAAMFDEHGVVLHPGRRVERTGVDTAPTFTPGRDTTAVTGVEVELDDGTVLAADAAVFGLGVEPVLGLAEGAGLAVDDGVVVDERLRTSDPAIWAAGDIASYPDPVLGRTRVEHVDGATTMGTAAGRSMAGADEPYTHTPYFYSVVFGTRWEAVGTLDPSLDVLEVDLDGDRVVAYYRDDSGAPVGVLRWNVDEDEAQRDAARRVLADAPTSEEALRGSIR
jgi:3-phenylpropionate/trans-cinnamate dioxygenase ferredoxin reductase component